MRVGSGGRRRSAGGGRWRAAGSGRRAAGSGRRVSGGGGGLCARLRATVVDFVRGCWRRFAFVRGCGRAGLNASLVSLTEFRMTSLPAYVIYLFQIQFRWRTVLYLLPCVYTIVLYPNTHNIQYIYLYYTQLNVIYIFIQHQYYFIVLYNVVKLDYIYTQVV